MTTVADTPPAICPRHQEMPMTARMRSPWPPDARGSVGAASGERLFVNRSATHVAAIHAIGPVITTDSRSMPDSRAGAM